MNIVQDVNKLKVPCREITKEDIKNGAAKHCRKLLLTIVKTLNEHNRDPLGLAANQIGLDRRICIVKNIIGKYKTFVNPVILLKAKPKLNYERCFSYPGRTFEALRYNIILVKYRTITGKFIIQILINRTARLAQHEFDHLNGIVPTFEQFENGSKYERGLL